MEQKIWNVMYTYTVSVVVGAADESAAMGLADSVLADMGDREFGSRLTLADVEPEEFGSEDIADAMEVSA